MAKASVMSWENKKVSNVNENIQMTVANKKLAVLNIVTFDIVDTDVEVVENDFFGNAGIPDGSESSTQKCIAYLITDKNGTVCGSNDWLDGSSKKFALETYPEEMIPVIKKSINLNKGMTESIGVDIHYVTFNKIEELSPEMLEVLQPKIEKSQAAYKDLNSQIAKFKMADGTSDLDSFLDRYMFKKHILIQGEKGGGKTYAVDAKLRDEGIDSEFISGHEGIEATDLLGYTLPSKDETVWLDGALTRAFRKAVDGKVALFIDETLRIPARELNILVGAITPSSVGTYRLRTNRLVNVIDGVGETEVIEVPMGNLWVIGTTNVGAGYAVDEIDDALADRFIVVNKITTNTELETILLSCASTDGISNKIVSELIEFYTQMRDLVLGGELEKNVNTRHLCEVLQFAENDAEIKSYLMDRLPTWCSIDTNGSPNKAEKTIITKLIKRIIK